MRIHPLAILALLGGCGDASDDSGTASGPTTTSTCDGQGTATLEVGAGGQTDFAPFDDAAPVRLTEQGGLLGVRIEFQTRGLDTTQGITSVLRMAFDAPETEDYLASLPMVCSDSTGVGWFASFAALPDDYQTSPGALDGRVVTFTATFTDHRAVTAGDEGSITLSLD